MTYKATLFAVSGEFVTEFRGSKTIQDVWDKADNMGSRWFFYPLHFVTTEKTVVGAPYGLEFLQGKRIETVRQWIKDNQEYITNLLN